MSGEAGANPDRNAMLAALRRRGGSDDELARRLGWERRRAHEALLRLDREGLLHYDGIFDIWWLPRRLR